MNLEFILSEGQNFAKLNTISDDTNTTAGLPATEVRRFSITLFQFECKSNEFRIT